MICIIIFLRVVGGRVLSDIGRIVNVGEREFILISRINYDGESYVYLMSSTSPIDILIAREEETPSKIVELVMIDDEMEKRRIYDLFLKGARLGLL